MESSDSEQSIRYCRQNPQGIMRYISLITVEPTLFLYMMAFMLTTVIEQTLFVYKACAVNHGFNDTVCNNINDEKYKEQHELVQVTASNFQQWNGIAGQIMPIILACFMGAWSDRRGRKLPMLLGLFGKFVYSVMIVVNASMATWPVEYIIYTATLPSALTGADVAIFAAAFSYITDVSTPENRTIRVTILDVIYLSTMPIGIALGAYLYSKVVNKSYAIMFAINATLMFLCLLYTFFKLDWRTNENQRPWREANNMLTDFFDKDHVVQSFKILIKPRPQHKRLFLLLFILTMALYVFQREESHKTYLYLSAVFHLNPVEISSFRTFQTGFQVGAMLIGIPVMSKLLHFRDTVIIMIGSLAHTLARVIFAAAPEAWWFYLGGAISGLGPVVAPVLRSLVSKIVPITERGKVFSLLSVADNAIPVLSEVIYTQVYNNTLETHPSTYFYVTISTQLTVFFITLFVHSYAQSSAFQQDQSESEALQTDNSQNEIS